MSLTPPAGSSGPAGRLAPGQRVKLPFSLCGLLGDEGLVVQRAAAHAPDRLAATCLPGRGVLQLHASRAEEPASGKCQVPSVDLGQVELRAGCKRGARGPAGRVPSLPGWPVAPCRSRRCCSRRAARGCDARGRPGKQSRAQSVRSRGARPVAAQGRNFAAYSPRGFSQRHPPTSAHGADLRDPQLGGSADGAADRSLKRGALHCRTQSDLGI